MRNEIIEQRLRQWSIDMTDKYSWLTIKFEYNDQHCRYLVSFYPSDKIEGNEDFCKESLAFEDQMYDEFKDDSPLFCDDETLFKLSEFAEVYPISSVSYNFTSEDSHSIEWQPSFENLHPNFSSISLEDDFMTNDKISKFPLAA